VRCVQGSGCCFSLSALARGKTILVAAACFLVVSALAACHGEGSEEVVGPHKDAHHVPIVWFVVVGP
jgi:hypothetical protein